jgi:hypothetical protein
MGDFFQLPPVGHKAIPDSLVNGATNLDHFEFNGVQLLSRWTKIDLTQQMRAAEDQQHTADLERFRNPAIPFPITFRMLNQLKTLSRQDFEQDPAWAFAPIITASNLERQHIINSRARRFASVTGVPVIRWRDPIGSPQSVRWSGEELANLYAHCDELHSLFVQGVSGYLVRTNLNVRKRLVNGTPVLYESLVIESEEDNRLIRNAAAGEVITLSRPPKALVIRCPTIEASVREGHFAWPQDHSLDDRKVLIPLYLGYVVSL